VHAGRVNKEGWSSLVPPESGGTELDVSTARGMEGQQSSTGSRIFSQDVLPEERFIGIIVARILTRLECKRMIDIGSTSLLYSLCTSVSFVVEAFSLRPVAVKL